MAKEKTAVKAKKVRLDASDKIVRGFAYVFISLFAALCLFPFLLIVATSFSSEKSIMQYGFQIWPREFSLYAYQLIFKTPMVMNKTYGLTIGLTVAGTIIGLFIVAMTGICIVQTGFPIPEWNIILYLFYNPVQWRPCTLLSSGCEVSSSERQLFCNFTATFNVTMADYSDEEFCKRYSV